MTTTSNAETIGIYQAKTHFASVIEQVLEGKLFVITKHGRPVAVIEPYEKQIPDLETLLADSRKARKLLNLRSSDMRELIGRDSH